LIAVHTCFVFAVTNSVGDADGLAAADAVSEPPAEGVPPVVVSHAATANTATAIGARLTAARRRIAAPRSS
jgi:hypothetical protein